MSQARHERDQQATTGQPIERGELLGHPEDVATGKQHRRAQFEPRVVGCSKGQCGQRVERRGGQDLGQPDRVEPQLIEVIDQSGQPRRIAVEGAHADPDADLHPPSKAGPSNRSTVANSSTGPRRSRVG